MKKNIMFMVINMNVGGTERALLNMIAEMPKDQYHITIFMLENYGGFLHFIPDHVTVKFLEDYEGIKSLLNKPPKESILNLLQEGHMIKSLRLLYIYLVSKITKNNGFLFKYILKDFPSLTTKYDIAVAYAGPMDFISYFVVNKIKSKRKIQWIHFDVTKIGFNINFVKKTYNMFDKVFVVSREAKNKLVELVPSLKKKTEVFLNTISPHLINEEVKKGIGFKDKDEFTGLRILTVGRLSSEKGQDLAILALVKLIRDGYDVKWYCLGEGSARDNYEHLIKVHNLGDKFILLGSDPNPYPYIDQCDIYVQPSRYEGYCLTLAEARVLKKPIITTNFTGAKEQIKHGETGLIVNIDKNALYQAIKKIIESPVLVQTLKMNLSEQSMDTKFKII